MALILEDGSVVENAQSFNSDDDLTAFASLRGITLPTKRVDREALLLLAMDYLHSRETQMKGCRVSASQELPYPRSGVYVYDFALGRATIPAQIKRAQLEAAIFAHQGNLLENKAHENISSKKGFGMEVSYFNSGTRKIKQFEKIDAYLKPLLKDTSNLMVRV